MQSHPDDEKANSPFYELPDLIDEVLQPQEFDSFRTSDGEAAHAQCRPYIPMRQNLDCALAIGEMQMNLEDYLDRATGKSYTIYDAQCTILARCANWDLNSDVTELGDFNLQVATNVQDMQAFACKYCPVLDSLEARLFPSSIDFEQARLVDRRLCEVVAEQFAPWAERYETQLRKGSYKILLRIPTVGITFRNSKREFEDLAKRVAREAFPEQRVSISFEPGYLFGAFCEGPGAISDFTAYRFYQSLLKLGGNEIYHEGGWDYERFTSQGFLDLLELAAGRKSGRFGFI